jgi:hypothetical protein
MDPARYDAFTQALVGRLAPDPRVLALLGLGSLADARIRDQYSDHDVWLVVTPGSEAAFLEDLTWLPNATDHLAVIRFGTRGATVLYHDAHVVEFAVFSEATLATQPTDRVAVLLDRAQLAARLSAVVDEARAHRAAQDRWPDAIANFAVLVWTGVQRHRRGEHLAAHKSLCHHAIDRFLRAAHAAGLLDEPAATFLDPWRRLETVHPALATALARTLTMPPPMAGLALLDLAVAYLRAPLPNQAWDAVEAVRRWIVQLGAT